MKSFLIAALLVTTNAFAINICDYKDVAELYQDMEQANIQSYKSSTHQTGFTNDEKKLIHATIVLQSWRSDYTQTAALNAFLDMWEGRVGSLAGSLEYYVIGGQNIVHAQYFPGDNEYGAFWVVNKKAPQLLAVIEDGEIYCQK